MCIFFQVVTATRMKLALQLVHSSYNMLFNEVLSMAASYWIEKESFGKSLMDYDVVLLAAFICFVTIYFETILQFLHVLLLSTLRQFYSFCNSWLRQYVGFG